MSVDLDSSRTDLTYGYALVGLKHNETSEQLSMNMLSCLLNIRLREREGDVSALRLLHPA